MDCTIHMLGQLAQVLSGQIGPRSDPKSGRQASQAAAHDNFETEAKPVSSSVESCSNF